VFKFAAQYKLRFPSSRGDLTAENLFDLPLKSKSGFDLDTVARTIHAELKSMGEESFVEDPSDDPRKKTLEVSLSIVKDVIKTKQDENAARLNKLKRAEERKKLLDAIAAKKDDQLSQATLDELEKKLSELEE
jgi:hypothetical protein